MKPNLRGKRITVMGLGVHGGAAGNIRWLAEQGALLTVTDLKTQRELADTLQELRDLPQVRWVLGEHREADFTDTDLVIRNPAVPRNSAYLQLARRQSVPIEMDSSLFFKSSPTENVVGVTGSKGKSSTTTFTAKLLQLKHDNVVTVGVEGTSPLAALDTLRPDGLAVFELSSWRLEALAEHAVSPSTAIVTSLYRDHLNTYDSYQHYVDTKKAIVKNQRRNDRVLLNYDDDEVRQWADEVASRVFWYSLGDTIPGPGICVVRGMISINTANPLTGIIPLFPVADVPLKSEHELRNMLPGIYLAWSSGVRPESLRLHVEELETLSHRLEPVQVVNDVTYINDSAATIPDATVAALRSLRDRHLVLILGGSDKQLTFEQLARELTYSRVRGIIFLPGTATETMQAEITGQYRVPPWIEHATSMADAVQQAKHLARQHDVVLLSPGATSFGLFKHEFDRGEQFKEAVEQLL